MSIEKHIKREFLHFYPKIQYTDQNIYLYFNIINFDITFNTFLKI